MDNDNIEDEKHRYLLEQTILFWKNHGAYNFSIDLFDDGYFRILYPSRIGELKNLEVPIDRNPRET